MNEKCEILLCDLDAFFAAVEQLDNPKLQGQPVIVGGDPDARGVVSTCSYEARKFGVCSAMPMKKALGLCPRAIVMPVNMRRYKEVSAQVAGIFQKFTPDIEPVSIDEAYLAVSKGQGYETGKAIRFAVWEDLKLPISIGVSINKLLSKIACELAKPDNIKALWPENVQSELWPLPVKVLPGVGPVTEKKLFLYGIKTVNDLANFPKDALVSILGKNAIVLHSYANGCDERKFELKQEIKSISEEVTFPQDIFDRDYVLFVLSNLSEEVSRRLRSKNLYARTISLKLRFANFSTITRDKTLSETTNKGKDIFYVIKRLFDHHCGTPPWRLVGVRISGLEKHKQLSLYSLTSEKEDRLNTIKDNLRKKYGRDVLYTAKKFRKNKSNKPGNHI